MNRKTIGPTNWESMCGPSHEYWDLHLLRAIRRRDVVRASRILLEGLSPFSLEEQTSRRDGGPLFWAACLGLLELVEILLAMGAVVDATNCWSATPLHAAADNNRLHIARLLLMHGANPNKRSIQGDTPCHLAAFRGNLDMVKLLVRHGADTTLKNHRSYDVPHEAESMKHFPIAAWVCEHRKLGADQQKMVESPKGTMATKKREEKAVNDKGQKRTRELKPQDKPSEETISLSRGGSFTKNLVIRQNSSSLSRNSIASLDDRGLGTDSSVSPFFQDRVLSWHSTGSS